MSNRLLTRAFLISALGIVCASSCWAQGSAVGSLKGSGGTPAATSSAAVVASPPVLPSPQEAASAVAAVNADYRIDTDDTISIVVSRHNDVGGTYHIPPDGQLRLQRLITPIAVRGKTCDELSTEITGKLVNEGKLVLRPGQVVVVVVGIRVRHIFVRGNAIGGKDLDLKNGWHIADLTAVMGGVPQPDRVKVLLTNPARPAPIPIDLAQALNHPESDANVLLQEGDTLSINSPQAKRLIIKNEGPRGIHDFDERWGLKQSLNSIGYSVTGATGDLRHAQLTRNQTPGDLNSPITLNETVDLVTLLESDSAKEVPFQDLDTLNIPISDNYVWITGAVGGMKKYYLPLDRKSYLVDVVTSSGGVADGQASIGEVKVIRTTADGKRQEHSYDLGKFMAKNDERQNPEIVPHDTIYVPTVKHTDVIGNIWTGFGLFNLLRVFAPGLSPRI